MREEHSIGDDNCPYSWLNEWLCEYVDGTMDPSLRRVFDEYVEANPELKAHVERLRHTRELLCQCSRRSQQEASDEVRARVQEQIECDMLRTPGSLRDVVRERPVTAFASTLMVALVVGMFAGATLFAPEVISTRPAEEPETVQYEERAPAPGRALIHSDPRLAPRRTATPHLLMQYDAGMPYVPALDTTSSTTSWSPVIARP